MNSYIFAGMGGQIISKLSNFLFKFLDSLIKDSNYQVDQIKEEKTEDGKKYVKYRIKTGGNHYLYMEVYPTDRDGYFDIIINGQKSSQSYTKRDVKEDKIDDIITDVVDDWYAESYETKYEITNCIGITLSKEDNKDNDVFYSVAVSNILCSTDNVRYASSLVNDILSDEEFVESLPAGESSFLIKNPSDNIDEITMISTEYPDYSQCNHIQIMMAYLKNFMDDVQTIYWNTCTTKLGLTCGGFLTDTLWSVKSQLDMLAQLSVEFYNSAPDCKSLQYDNSILDTSSGFNCAEATGNILKKDIDECIDSIEVLLCNYPEDVQITIQQQIIRYLKNTKVELRRYFSE